MAAISTCVNVGKPDQRTEDGWATISPTAYCKRDPTSGITDGGHNLIGAEGVLEADRRVCGFAAAAELAQCCRRRPRHAVQADRPGTVSCVMLSRMSQIPPQISGYLHPGERVLWSGSPDPTVRFAPSDVYLVPFTILWCGFSIFWEVGVVSSGAPIIFWIWGVPFVAVGLYLVFGRFIYKKRRKQKTVYALTTERALIAVGATFLVDGMVTDQTLVIRRSRDRNHVTVTICYTPAGRMGNAFATANTGLDAFNRTGEPPIAFYDVAPPDPLLAALDAIRAPQ